jgi:hypothetical protein
MDKRIADSLAIAHCSDAISLSAEMTYYGKTGEMETG